MMIDKLGNIYNAWQACGKNISETARLMNCSRQTIRKALAEILRPGRMLVAVREIAPGWWRFEHVRQSRRALMSGKMTWNSVKRQMPLIEQRYDNELVKIIWIFEPKMEAEK